MKNRENIRVSHTSETILTSEIQRTALSGNVGMYDKPYGKGKDIYDGYFHMEATRPLANSKAF